MPVALGHFQVNAGNYDDDTTWGATIYNSPYYKPTAWETKYDWNAPIAASGPGISEMKGGFGVAATNGSYTRVLSAASDYLYVGPNNIELENKYLNNLSDGEYWLIGFPVENRTSEQKKLGKFIVKSDAFTYVKIPDATISIGYHAFADCPNLAYIYIPALTTQIDDEAFGNKQGLTIIGNAGSTAETYAKEHNYSFIAVP